MAELDRQRGERIRELREAHSWTQRQLADRLNVDPKTVHNWEAGREINPTNLRELAELTKVTPDYIRYGEREMPDLTGMFSNGDRSQMDRIEENQQAILDNQRQILADVAAMRDERAAAEARLATQMRSIARKLDTEAKGTRNRSNG